MFWKRWDLSKFVSAAPINNIVMRMDDARLFRFTEAVMSRLFAEADYQRYSSYARGIHARIVIRLDRPAGSRSQRHPRENGAMVEASAAVLEASTTASRANSLGKTY